MKYFVIADEDAVLGFSLAGVEGESASTVAEAAAAFDAAIADPEIGILAISERVAELIRSRVDRYLFSEAFPLIVEIPDRMGRMPDRPTLRDTVNNAIGIKLG
ncbi:hypothetical protein MASR2M29_01050 [Spirochaetota bacterium]